MDLNEKFEIKSEAIGKLYKQMLQKELIYDPYYQRKFVWETKHQVEFIKTILLGLPCPEIFVADGEIDLDTQTHYVHVIDGQQRLRTIESYFKNDLKVDGNYYKDLTDDEKRQVSAYQIGLVKLKYDPSQNEKEISEIFTRLNIGNYELTETEKTISKFSDNEFVLLSRLISNDIAISIDDPVDEEDEEEEIEKNEIIANIKNNPFITDFFKKWASSKDFSIFKTFFLSREIYSAQELRRNNNSKDAIDMIAIFTTKKFHSRILKNDLIESYTSEVNKNRNSIYRAFSLAINIFNQIEVPEVEGYKKKKYLYIRSNAFSLFVALLLNEEILLDIDIKKLNLGIQNFCQNLPLDFVAAARNSNMDRKQRELRNDYLDKVIKESI